MNSQPSYGGRNPDEEKRVLAKSKCLLNWLTQRNFDKIKDEIVQTIRESPSAFVIKSLVCCIFDMAMLDNAYILFARLCVELFNALPPFPSDESHGEITTFLRLFLSKCRMELEESNCWKFIKTVRVLAEIFKNRMVTETTRQSIIQALQLESNYNEEVKLRKEAEDAIARKKEALDLMKRLLESYKEEQGQLHLQAQGLEQKYQEELQLRKETEFALAVEQEY